MPLPVLPPPDDEPEPDVPEPDDPDDPDVPEPDEPDAPDPDVPADPLADDAGVDDAELSLDDFDSLDAPPSDFSLDFDSGFDDE